MQLTEVDPSDAAAFAAWFAVLDAARAADTPGEPGWQEQELRALARSSLVPGSPQRTLTTAAVLDGRTVGASRLDLPQQDNRHVAELAHLAVRPDARGAGVGEALLVRALQDARDAGREVLLAPLEEHDGPSPAGRALAARHGFVCGQVEVRRDLLLPQDPARLDALEQACRPFAAGYAVRLWEGTCPEDLLADRALLSRRMSTDAPIGDVPRGEEQWDEARVRFGEQLLREQGRARLSAGAVHEASGRLVAFTDLVLPTGAPERAYQWDTLVLREHRGARLGTLVKLANLRRVAAAWPRTVRISTWNAQENAPMIAVNEALGCVVSGTETVWQRTL